MRVWKYSLQEAAENEVRFTVELPKDAKPLTVMNQGGEAQMWALVDPGQSVVNRTFLVVGTGWEINDYLNGGEKIEYIGTFPMQGWMVFHLFEVTT